MKRNRPEPSIGDYVLATKYGDGDPGDHFAVGYYAGRTPLNDRHLVVHGEGIPFRANGFRRVKKISAGRGSWLVEHFPEIERSSHSVWWWARRSMAAKVDGWVEGGAKP
jgi:hypothetical protein